MGRTILTVIGVILAIWLAFTVLGWLFSLLKFFLFLGVVATVVFLVVKVVAGSGKSHR